MMLLANVGSHRSSARKRIRQVLQSGAGYENFCRYVVACGGDCRALEAPARIVGKAHKTIVKATSSGYISHVDTAGLGHLSGMLGAGRRMISDRIDPVAGMEILVRIAQKVSAGDELAVLYSSDRKRLLAVAGEVAKTFQVSDESPSEERLILRRMTGGNG
jgi:pyrimidine-nucleoside phosphorylase